MKRTLQTALSVLAFASGCSTYQYAKNVRVMAYDVGARGESIGPVRGEDCQEFILGYALGDMPTLDEAVSNAKSSHGLRSITNVSTDTTGFNAVVYAKQCLIVKGNGYK